MTNPTPHTTPKELNLAAEMLQTRLTLHTSPAWQAIRRGWEQRALDLATQALLAPALTASQREETRLKAATIIELLREHDESLQQLLALMHQHGRLSPEYLPLMRRGQDEGPDEGYGTAGEAANIFNTPDSTLDRLLSNMLPR